MTPSTHRWSSLSPQQVGRYAEYFVKMQLVLHGFEVYASEVDDRGIDFVLRREPGCYWDVQVKSLRNKGYVFAQKSKFRIRPNLLMALVLFRDAEPDLFLIPAARWLKPDSVFVDRDYEGLKSAPEYGLNLSVKWLDKLDPLGSARLLKASLTMAARDDARPDAQSERFTHRIGISCGLLWPSSPAPGRSSPAPQD